MVPYPTALSSSSQPPSIANPVSCLKRPGKATPSTTIPPDKPFQPKVSFANSRKTNFGTIRPGILELCAGSATLSYVAEKLGFFAVPVDYSRNKFQPKIPTVKLNLAEDDSVSICIDLILSGSIQVVTAAIPCGTASRAREIYIPGGPKPLRSDTEPYGLANLSGTDLLRVETANRIYSNASKILLFASEMGCICFAENPDRSLVWQLTEYKHLLELGWLDVRFQHCRWTPNRPMRPKWTRLRTNCKALLALQGDAEGKCQLSHDHLQWGRSGDGTFDTAGEAEYNPEMCRQILDICIDELQKRGFVFNKETFDSTLEFAGNHKKRRAVATTQPRGNKLPPLMSEFKSVQKMTVREANQLQAKVLRPYLAAWILEAGSKEAATSETNVKDAINLENISETISSTDIPDDPNSEVVAGVFRTPEEYVAEACALKHPSDLQGGVQEELVHAIFDIFAFPPAHHARSMAESAKWFLHRSKATKDANEGLFKQASPQVREVLKGKNLALAQELIDKWSYPDSELVKDTLAGFSLTAKAKHTGVFEYRVNLPSATEQTVRQSSTFHNAAMLSKCSSSGDNRVDLDFWEQNMAEQQKGWLQGPFYLIEEVIAELDGQIPHLVRRFPLVQSAKIRSIDDYREANLNSIFSSEDKLTLMDTDTLAAVIRLIEQIISEPNKEVVFPSGVKKKICVHKSWGNDVLNWRGKTKDLQSAYKQLAVEFQSRWAATIVVFDPHKGKPAIFIQSSLPFGASASVLHFNRWAKFIWFLGVKEFNLVWTCFFDDYPLLAPEILTKATDAAISVLMKTLGWGVSEGEKDLDWNQTFAALGVVYDITNIGTAESTVGNKPARVESISNTLQNFREKGQAAYKDLESCRGKLTFTEAHIFGRAGRGACSALSLERGHVKHFSERDDRNLAWLIKWLATSVPRHISPKFVGPPLLLFTDGACENFEDPNNAVLTMGACLLDRRDNKALVFGCRISKALEQEWRSENPGKRQFVTETELLPQLVAKTNWRNRIAGSKMISFLDSNPSKFALIKGTSESVSCENIVRACALEDARHFTWNWFTRVPTKSNIADGPSRLEFPVSIGSFTVEKCEVVQPPTLSQGSWTWSSMG